MMKAEEYLLKAAYSEELTEAEKDIAFYEIGFYREDILRAMKEYAKEAIVEDRKNVAKHAKSEYMQENPFGSYEQNILSQGGCSVNKNSIINAPQITLL